MKIFAFLLLFGVASAASFQEMLDNDADEFPLEFLEEMQMVPAMQEHFQEFDIHAADDEDKSELRNRLKEVLEKVHERIKDALEKGKKVGEEFWKELDKAKEFGKKLKDVREELGEKGRELMDKIREKTRDYVKMILEKVGTGKRAADEEALAELNLRDVLNMIKEHIKKTVDPELLKEKIKKIFGQGSEFLDQLLQTLKDKGRNKMLILIDRLLEDDEDRRRSARGISDYWEKVKDYFKDLKIDLKEKYSKFGEWVKDVLDKGMEHSKDKMQNIKAIAKEFLKHAKGISKEIAAEAGDFFKNYKEELGNVWDEIKERVNEIRNKNN